MRDYFDRKSKRTLKSSKCENGNIAYPRRQLEALRHILIELLFERNERENDRFEQNGHDKNLSLVCDAQLTSKNDNRHEKSKLVFTRERVKNRKIKRMRKGEVKTERQIEKE